MPDDVTTPMAAITPDASPPSGEAGGGRPVRAGDGERHRPGVAAPDYSAHPGDPRPRHDGRPDQNGGPASDSPPGGPLPRRKPQRDRAASGGAGVWPEPAEPAPGAPAGHPMPGGARVRGPFEPAGRESGSAASAAAPQADQGPRPGLRTPPPPAPPGAAKLDQIKDLYLTAEAIGEDALDKHFQQVSERQRQLIREYFEQAVAARWQEGDPGQPGKTPG